MFVVDTATACSVQ